MSSNTGKISYQNCGTLKKMLNLREAAILVKAGHYCIKSRGVNHTVCTAVTKSICGAFLPIERAVIYMPGLRFKTKYYGTNIKNNINPEGDT